jgi:hypothetical protein
MENVNDGCLNFLDGDERRDKSEYNSLISAVLTVLMCLLKSLQCCQVAEQVMDQTMLLCS